MKSGMTAAEALFEHFSNGEGSEVSSYRERLEKSWVFDELHKVRNIRPSFRWGFVGWHCLFWVGYIFCSAVRPRGLFSITRITHV